MAGARRRTGTALNSPAAPLTGLFGGSFNPAHGGHRRVTLFAIEALGLDEVWWLVSPGNVLKPVEGMAPLEARLASAIGMSRNAPIRPTAIERELGTRFSVDTLRAIRRRYPKRRFIWLMGADNLAQFHKWKHWRQIAREMPIAVIARPGYDSDALASPAMAWLRRWRQRPGQFVSGAMRSAPALTILRFDPDHRSASAIRAHDPDWSHRMSTAALRDAVSYRPVKGSTENRGKS
ncbi:nicotinate-nucleotide adenylyltransferase [Novosphingobium taihuense]|uniref:Probable nicotinate-nucleotide adenylyltransferase n=1 Tax=Novosphingobium taihuense TaxID=260085 RepID=A0A7W7EUM7_9SPHN|nr:nicotinate-nucleotide adenylyltransferase [Novosphingobium taihuense]MBB4614537.1 nicotinate-nucleotide adenylyltransferase [Novosphingobium taihuense]TWH86221.1 nicotinate-nucleotide adenylyltransferase [Novosphingobium taihuense]